MRMRSTIGNLFLAVLYVAVYFRCYVSFLSYHFGYAGYDLYRRDTVFLAASVVIAVLPAFLYRGVRGVSSVISVVIYFILYVPIIVTFALGSAKPANEILLVELVFMLGMALLFGADAIVVRNPFLLEGRLNLMPIALTLTCVSVLYMLLVYRGSLVFSSFGEDLYDVRSANEGLGTGLVTRYLSSWLSTVLIPLCFAYGLTARKYWYYLVATIACVVLYMAAANKIMILLPIVYILFFLLVRKRLSAIYPILAVVLSLLILVLVAIAPGGVAFLVSAIVLNRTIGNGGQLTATYYDFFTFHAQTDYSHVNGIKLLTHPYPYGDLAVGQVIGQYYWSPLANTNANFWATDGIAALGLVGVLFASVGCALLFAAMNSITRVHDTRFVALCFLPFMITLLNQSMFSSFWSGGGLFVLLFFLFNRRSYALNSAQKAPRSSLPARNELTQN
jgi:hypothetical protein